MISAAVKLRCYFIQLAGRAGDRGALDAGCLPGLLPGGRPVAEPAARVDAQATWGVASLPSAPGLAADEQLAASAAGELSALVVAGLEPADFADPAAAYAGLEEAGFVVSIEARLSEVAKRADVVLPIALIDERAGHFVNWEGRERALRRCIVGRNTMTDLRILAALADGLGCPLGVRTAEEAKAELDELGSWALVADPADASIGATAEPVEPTGAPAKPATEPAGPAATAPQAPLGPGEAVLSTWRTLIDDSRSNDYEENLQATARKPVLKVGPETATALGLADGGRARVSRGGSLDFEVVIQPDLITGVVWLPYHQPGLSVAGIIGAGPGDVVRVEPAPAEVAEVTT